VDLIEPLMIVLLGLGVGTLLASVLIPIYNLASRARRGFTLIELLVVIAIIGILSAVVLASLNTARQKGNYAAIKSNLSTIQTQAELYYDSNSSSYGTGAATTTTGATACIALGGIFSDTTIKAAINSAANAGATVNCGIGGGAAGSFYDVIATSPAGNWCVNSQGVSTGTPTASVVC
jgi:prepilin-type N-terminal cleavage/methylation domain-containing protein